MNCPGCGANLDFIKSSRVLIRQDPAKEGIIELKKDVPDISLGERLYAQVRIRVGSACAYIKGMAIYSDNIPEGYDVIFYIGQEFGENGKLRGYGIDTNKEFKKPMTIIKSDAEIAWDRWENSLPLKKKGETK